MPNFLLICCFFLFSVTSFSQAQGVRQRISKAYQRFEADSQLRHASSSLLVVNARTGTIVFERNSQLGLAPASTQKIITAATAFELLGKDFRYITPIGFNGQLKNGTIHGDLIIEGSGDPTLGSKRYAGSSMDCTLAKILALLQKLQVREIEGSIVLDNSKFGYQPLPGGWIWDDIGNYYGAGTWGINWNENQYDLNLVPGLRQGDSVRITGTEPSPLEIYSLLNLLKTGPPGSGDNGYIYLPPYAVGGFVEGTVPAGEKKFTISGSLPFPAGQFGADLQRILEQNHIRSDRVKTSEGYLANMQPVPVMNRRIGELVSPRLDSVIFWFLKKSINLYGEALLKTMASLQKNAGVTDSGTALVKDFWRQKGIDKEELNILDGSGLSPQNRVTTHAQVEVLRFARTRDWFPLFFSALPEYNHMKMKSGSIRDVRGYCGYQKSADGTEYVFSFLVNNFTGSPAMLVNKMYLVLDELK
jgi:D-alanyl-D-alanine carboxypeptidase/D-alanyl-D-alanine-endopeptidase (penicillin-binding protein 4)